LAAVDRTFNFSQLPAHGRNLRALFSLKSLESAVVVAAVLVGKVRQERLDLVAAGGHLLRLSTA
jgi:hypothetical protein